MSEQQMDEKKISAPLSCCLNKFEKEEISKLCYQRIPTGFEELDEKIGGGISTGLTVLGAGSGMGKSTFALQMAQNISAQGIPVLFFSMEMTEVRIASKLISKEYFLETGKTIASDDFLNADKIANFKKKEWVNLDKAREIVGEACKKLYIIEGRVGMNSSTHIIDWINVFLDKMAGVDGTKTITPVVIVDYLQILTSARDNAPDNARFIVDENLRNLKSLSQNMPVILISSLNREGYKNEISFEAFKESGTIEYSADEVWGIQFEQTIKDKDEAAFKREKAKMPREVEINILKQRYHASESRVSFLFYCENDCFIEKSKLKKVEQILKEKRFGAMESEDGAELLFGSAPRAN